MMARRPAVLSILHIVCLLLAAPASGQTAALGDNIRTASNVGPFMDQINRFVRERATALAGGAPAAQSTAREELVSAVAPTVALSNAFLTAYTKVVNDELAKLTQNESARVRLNTAIIAARVAEGAKNAGLQPLTLTLLNDSSDAVVWWALRAARAILPHTLANPPNANNALLTAVVQLGEKRAKVIAAVYDALAIDQSSTPAPQRTKVLAVTVPALHTVLRGRVNQYLQTLPPEVTAEIRATTYLTAKDQYDVQSTTDRVTTAQLISDLMGVAEQRSAELSPEQRREMVMMLRPVGGAMEVIGQWETNNMLQTAARPVRQLPLTATAQDIQNAVRPVYNAVRGVPKFAKITPPPKISQAVGSGSASAPATQGAAAGGPR